MSLDGGGGGGGSGSGQEQITWTATLEAEGENDWQGESGAASAWQLGQLLWDDLMPINVGAMIDQTNFVGTIG